MSPSPADRAVLFDFFGTLVEYQPDRSRLGYPATFRLARSCGFDGTARQFVATWDRSSARLEAESKRTLREFSMSDAAAAFADDAGLALTPAQCDELGRQFVGEWQEHIHAIDGAAGMVRRLADSWKVGVVSNTHDREMVPRFLERMGIGAVVSTVVLSVVHGRCKPHLSIYADALDELSITPPRAVFVGDSYVADFEGPEAVGIRAFLIDPADQYSVTKDRRLTSVLDLEARLHDEH